MSQYCPHCFTQNEDGLDHCIRCSGTRFLPLLLGNFAAILLMALLIFGVGNSLSSTAFASGTPEETYQAAEALLAEGKKAAAAMTFYQLGNYRDAQEKAEALWFESGVRKTIAAGPNHTVGLRTDGTVVATGENDNGQCNVDGWTDIVAVAADLNTIGLRADGTVVTTGSWSAAVSGWTDIVAIVGDIIPMGLRADGTVVVADSSFGDVSGWTDIVAIAGGITHMVGLRADGTVVAVGDNSNGQCDVSDWTDIVAISAAFNNTLGVRADGTVVSAGLDPYSDGLVVAGWTDIVAIAQNSVSIEILGLRADGSVVALHTDQVDPWRDIVAIASEFDHQVGLCADGTVVATMGLVGQFTGGTPASDVSDWTDIRVLSSVTTSAHSQSDQASEALLTDGDQASAGVRDRSYKHSLHSSIAAGRDYTVGLLSDGTVVATGENSKGQCNVSDWTNIISIAAGYSHTVGLRSDGTVVATGQEDDSSISWSSIKRKDHGDVCDVESWTDIVAIDAGENHTVGLRSDGTVVAAGHNSFGECDVEDWTDIVAIAAGNRHTVGLRANGTIVGAGDLFGWSDSLSSDPGLDLPGWTDIVAISASWGSVMGIRSDDTLLVAIGSNYSNYYGELNVEDWTDIVDIVFEGRRSVGLRADGTVVATGGNNYHGENDLDRWTDIVDIAVGRTHTVGLRSDGSVLAVGSTSRGECKVSGWTDIRVPG